MKKFSEASPSAVPLQRVVSGDVPCTVTVLMTMTRVNFSSCKMSTVQLLEKIAKWAIPVAATFSLVQTSMYDVDGGYRAVIFDRLQGVKKETVGEGTHFVIPWLQKAIVFDVRTKPRTISSTTGSRDMQTVTLSLRVLHRPDQARLSEIYQTLGMDYDERVLPSIGNEVLKSIVAQFDAGELITQRELVHP
jgi:prohibitin 1